MFGLGLYELLIILIVALIIFGPGRLPQIGSSLGKAIRDFREGIGSKGDRPQEESQSKQKDAGSSLPKED